MATATLSHVMLDPEHCSLCRACEESCPWECLYAIDENAQPETIEGEVAVFVVEDHNCTRCGLCVEFCPSDCLYFARLPAEAGATRTMGVVPYQGAVA